jgi:glutaredoxin-like protein NrdH
MPESRGSVPGTHDKHQITFYGLSTCIWCRKTRQFLEDQGVKFDFVYVDLIHGQEREEIKEIVRRWNSAVSFPTIVVDDEQAVVGFKTDKLKEVLEL